MDPERPIRQEPFSSNALRLTGREWLTAAAFFAAVAIALPTVWRGIERFDPGPDYRIPYGLSEDYWLFDRYGRAVSDRGRILLIGDSFVWGQFVDSNETLTHHLNDRAGEERFANLGLDGAYPIALEGLIRHYGRSIRGRDVILHLNLLWLSSPEADLQVETVVRFNHPRLVSQFVGRIPCYQATLSSRVGVLLERSVPLLGWTRHLRGTGFENSDLPHWTLDHPYTLPLPRILPGSGGLGDDRHPDVRPREEGGRPLQRLPWVELESSRQWRAFLKLVDLLRARGNRVVVMTGPLNEHLLDLESRGTYRRLLEEAVSRLQRMGLDVWEAPLLPAALYADTSHPLDEGYDLLADGLWRYLMATEEGLPADHQDRETTARLIR